jgi:hypothetical protein
VSVSSSPVFTGTVTIPSPFTLGSTSVTTTGPELNYLNASTGTTGSGYVVFSISPNFTGTPTAQTQSEGNSSTAIANTAFVVSCQQLTDTLTYVSVFSGTCTPTSKAGSTKSDVIMMDTAETGNVYMASPAGTYALGQIIEIDIRVPGGSAKTITYNSIYLTSTNNATLPATTGSGGKTLVMVFEVIYSGGSNKLVLRSYDTLNTT